MEIGFDNLIIVLLIIISIYFLNDYYVNEGLTTIKSTVDNNEYIVQSKEDSEEAANLIAKVRAKLILLVEHLKKSYGNSDERVNLLTKNFRPDKLQEGKDIPGMTSYSINKGEKIIMCLRNKDKFVDINTLMFVALHEMGHLATKSIGHNPEFWEVFKWLLEESINIGIYIKQDFETSPENYCNMIINSSPLNS